MSYDREQWEDVAFQVFEDMGGSIRNGYYPTGEGLVDGNVAIDYTFGNFPIQPNEDRAGMVTSLPLGVLDSHKIAAVEWNAYPLKGGPTAGSRNYKVTDAEYLGGYSYQYTSQNDLQVGDVVIVSGAEDFSFSNAQQVVYADKTKFIIENELTDGPKVTGLYEGRVDVIDEPWNGHTFSGEGALFYAPRVGLFDGATIEESKVTNYFNYLREIGVDPEILKDMTFVNGEDEWDNVDGDSNYDGIVLYSYIPAEVVLYENAQGNPVYGSDLDGCILASLGFVANDELYVGSNNVEDFMVMVVSNDPRKDNQGWW